MTARAPRPRTSYVVILTRVHASDGRRTEVYGPYSTFKRAEGDAQAWQVDGAECTVEPLTRPH